MTARVRGMGLAIFCGVVLAACSVEKLPPIRMVHRETSALPRRVVVLPIECTRAEFTHRTGDDPRAWCQGIDAMVASDLAFHGMQVVDLARLPASNRTRKTVEVSIEGNGTTSERRDVTVKGPMYSEVDAWSQRAALAKLGVDGLVRVQSARLDTWPVRALALVRVTRFPDQTPIVASVCELEVSRMDDYAATVERAVKCALAGVVR